MKEITEDYCDFETAKLLKVKGFNEKCLRTYFGDGKMSRIFDDYDEIYNENLLPSVVAAPTLQMASKWLREVHKFHVFTTYDGDRGYQPNINNLRTNHLVSMEMYNGFKHEEALETAIVYCLENLI